MKKVQSYILNISAIKSIEELKEMADNNLMHTVEHILIGEDPRWCTAPKWISKGDIVFFYHAKTAKQDNTRLRRFIMKNPEEFKGSMKNKLLKYLDYCDEIYRKFGGKIFAVGKVKEDFVIYSKSDLEHPHFRSRIFAPIGDIKKLEYPVPSNQFEDFCPIRRQTGVTAVLGNDFMKIKRLVLSYNDVPYLNECKSMSIPVKDIKNGNWIMAANENGRKYLCEEQFRKYYVDYFLTNISDENILSEVTCVKEGKASGRADNCIKIDGDYFFVEVKLNVFSEKNIFSQLKQYCDTDSFRNGNKIINENICTNLVFVIDCNALYLFDSDDEENCLHEIIKLNEIKCPADMRKLRTDLSEMFI